MFDILLNIFSQGRKCYYHVFADPDWPHSRHTLMAIIITTCWPIRGQYLGHVTSVDQSGPSIQVTWPVLTNQGPVFACLTNTSPVSRHQMVTAMWSWPLNPSHVCPGSRLRPHPPHICSISPVTSIMGHCTVVNLESDFYLKELKFAVLVKILGFYVHI